MTDSKEFFEATLDNLYLRLGESEYKFDNLRFHTLPYIFESDKIQILVKLIELDEQDLINPSKTQIMALFINFLNILNDYSDHRRKFAQLLEFGTRCLYTHSLKLLLIPLDGRFERFTATGSSTPRDIKLLLRANQLLSIYERQ